jgi:hypothetical protein
MVFMRWAIKRDDRDVRQSADRVNGAVSAVRAPAQEWREVYRVKFCDVEHIAHVEC